jgi:hypothetical protein
MARIFRFGDDCVILSSDESDWIKDNWPEMIVDGKFGIRDEEWKTIFLLKYGPIQRRMAIRIINYDTKSNN